MFNKRILEIVVGLFMLAGLGALFVLAFKMSSLSQYSGAETYQVTAFFDDIGDLKVRAPVTISGVRVGEVADIILDPKVMRAKVVLLIDKKEDILPADTSAKILTAGLIGANYISLIPGYDNEIMKDGSVITETQPAIILENLIGQLMYQLKDKKEKK
ncbi:MAG: outer membrane lipid asymmetry maintenance protein MlaD [Gammaproteobacteria bacterium GWE2_37_16]|nr:MAG: outer membrane lipid asymmetry maintenance protein MlaD [Gammaproteobacteria bacterium GWE2_37_16]